MSGFSTHLSGILSLPAAASGKGETSYANRVQGTFQSFIKFWACCFPNIENWELSHLNEAGKSGEFNSSIPSLEEAPASAQLDSIISEIREELGTGKVYASVLDKSQD